MKPLIALGVALAFLFVASPASAALLTEADYEYLATQNVPKESRMFGRMSPLEQSRLHGLINDPRTAADPLARAKNVHDALMEFEDNQDWERKNPGSLWDVPKRKTPDRRPIPAVPN